VNPKKIRLRFSTLVQQLEWYSFLLPTLVCLLMLCYLPVFQAVKYSFSSVTTTGFETTYVGFHNYIKLLQSPRFLNAIKNTLILGLYSLVSIPLGFLLASALQNLGKNKTQSFFRVMFYMPNIITGVSVVLMFQYILLQDGGLLNSFLSLFVKGDVHIGWLVDKHFSKIAVTFIAAWRGVGYCMLISLAGLQAIPLEIYESADIDGASKRQRLRYITFPCMVPTFTFLIVTRMISGLARFDDLYMLGGTSGSPTYSLQTLIMYVYQYSFSSVSPNYGMSSAAAMIFFVVVFVTTLANLKITNFGNERDHKRRLRRR